MHPRCQESVARALRSAKRPDHASEWRIFSRLARPGLIAIRTVARSSGLDIFLLENEELRGIEDVAEMMFFGVEDSRGLLEALRPNASLFITFLRLNWDALSREKLWRDYGLPQPSRSRIFRGFCAALRKASLHGSLGQHAVEFHIGGGIGDCDALIVGTTNSRHGLNKFLSTLSQLGTDNLALHIGVAAGRLAYSLPIVTESVTELGVGWELFQESLHAARAALEGDAGPEFHPEEEKLHDKINQSLDGDLRAAVFLRRSRSTLSTVGEQLKRITPRRWVMQEVLGDADILLRFTDPAKLADPEPAARETPRAHPQDLKDLICLTARLDRQATSEPSFPRRHSVVLSFDEADPLAEASGRVARGAMLGDDRLLARLLQEAIDAPADAQAERDLSRCAEHLATIHDLRLREELRIIERMVERCAILQRQPDLPAETRRVSQLGLRRIARTLDQLATHQEGDPRRITLRHSLVNSGAHLERTISHLSRGNVPLLLATPSQARALDHFSSETILARALAAPASSVAGRLARILDESRPLDGNPPAHWASLLETLRDMEEPIIYTSHGLDFALARPLGILHVPRWIMWYPTASSLILHEVGHAVFNDGRLDDLLLACVATLRERSHLLVWCAEIVAGAGAAETADSRLAGGPAKWRTDQHEIAAELFHRLLGYPAAGAEAYLFDQLEYLHAIINRIEKLDRISFITRILTVHLAHALLIRSQQEGSPWQLDFEGLKGWIHDAVESFREHLRGWGGAPPPPFSSMKHWENEELVREVKMLAGTLAVQSAPAPEDGPGAPGDTRDLRDYHSAVGRAVQRGVFMAMAASAGEEVSSMYSGTMIAHLVWQATLRCSRDPESPTREPEQKQFDKAVRTLQAGEVPDFMCPWPERLPRMLQHAIRRSSEASVLVHQRMALSLCMADWMSVRHSPEPGRGQPGPAK
ncbi:MAG TPA: hypothetical protein VGO11_05070 [Chthoniobacteraceae bacterium]|nr:hypothetical protein [Chthoniobacteraceae bacterium]